MTHTVFLAPVVQGPWILGVFRDLICSRNGSVGCAWCGIRSPNSFISVHWAPIKGHPKIMIGCGTSLWGKATGICLAHQVLEDHS